MDNNNNPKQQAIERLKQASSILVTVSNNPSVDQLAACIGLTLTLNKLGKHGTAVYSGATPSTIEFLKPEQTLEKNTDSLRDFIIALDKAKADKLRYKVEDKVVRIFITPYKTSLSEKDLEFSLGGFNVDAVVALGVHKQTELDQAITAHGRILHDAVIITINTTSNNDLGAINWQDPTASSLSEMVAGLAGQLGKDAKEVLDVQIATALLTGIVAATERFSNNKTSAITMSVSSQLIAAGANQQLVATKLEQPKPPPPPPPPKPVSPEPLPPQPTPVNGGGSPKPTAPIPAPADGTLYIEHEDKRLEPDENADNAPNAEHQIEIDKEGILHNIGAPGSVQNPSIPPVQPPPGPSVTMAGEPKVSGGGPFMFEPPELSGTLTANTRPEGFEPGTDPLSLPPSKSSSLMPDAINQAVTTAVNDRVAESPAEQQPGSPAIQMRHPLDMPIPAPPAQPNQVVAAADAEDKPSGVPAPPPSAADNASAPPPVPPPLPPVF